MGLYRRGPLSAKTQRFAQDDGPDDGGGNYQNHDRRPDGILGSRHPEGPLECGRIAPPLLGLHGQRLP
jgi:hypothetical protein